MESAPDELGARLASWHRLLDQSLPRPEDPGHQIKKKQPGAGGLLLSTTPVLVVIPISSSKLERR
jgi:hypothetical protein